MELAKLGSYRITGLDLSHTFVKMAAKRAAAAGLNIDFMQGSASNLPFPKSSFDFLLCRAAFKNFGEPVAALEEMHRVLKPEGRALIIDLKGGASPAELGQAVDAMDLSTVNRFLTRMAFKSFLLKRAYTRGQFEQMLTQAGIERFEIVESGVGLEITLLK